MRHVLAPLLALAAAYQPFADDRRKADAVLGKDNVSARGEVDVVFQLADKLSKCGEAADALHYYQEGSRLHP